MITALRECPRQLRSTEGSQLMIELIRLVIGTEWEEVLWPTPLTNEEKVYLYGAQELFKGTDWDYWSKR